MPTHVTHGQNVSTHPGQGQGQGQGHPPPFAQLPIVGVTSDSTLWTADTVCVTADGRVICIPAYVAEPIGISVTADTTLYTADNTTWPTADGGVGGATDSFDATAIAGGAVISADVLESAAASDLPDAAVEGAGNVISADVVEAATALDQLAVEAETVVGVGGGARYRPRRPLPVYGVGYGILPPLWGEAHGTVGVVGQSAAQVLVRATAVGACGQAGDAAAVLKALSVAGTGAVGTRGTGSGMIVKFNGSATGRHDDEAAVIAFLLAA